MRRIDLRRLASHHRDAVRCLFLAHLVTLQCDASHLPQTWPSDSASESERQIMPSERQTDFGAAYGSNMQVSNYARIGKYVRMQLTEYVRK